MGHERWFRGQHDGQDRPFDWLTAARQHGIPDKLARVLYEQAVRQVHGTTPGRVQELYLALLADARRHAARPSPGKVTRTMRLQAHQTGKRRRPHISQRTGQPIAPGKRPLTSYIEPAEDKRHAQEKELEPLEIDAATVSAAILGHPKDVLTRTRSPDDQDQLGKAHAVPSQGTRPSLRETVVPGTVAHRQLLANLAAAFGYFEELEALEEERTKAELATDVEASQPREVGSRHSADSEMYEWPPPPELQFQFPWQARGSITSNAWKVAADDLWSKTSVEHVPMAMPSDGVPNAPAIHFSAMIDRHGATLYRQATGPIDAEAEQLAVEEALRRTGSGEPMPEPVRKEMETRLGTDLGGVRIYTDTLADRAARAVNARAFTVGENIFFAHGAFAPGERRGMRLLAHELIHVVQAIEGRIPKPVGAEIAVSTPTDAHEQEAERRATEVVAAPRQIEAPYTPSRPLSSPIGAVRGPVLLSRDPPEPSAPRFQPEDIVQGPVNDCYLLAALTALTSTARGRASLAQTVRQVDASTFEVTLFLRPDPQGPFQPRQFTVGGFVAPERGGAPQAAAPWVRAVERAYAQLYGGRSVISGETGGIRIGGAQRALEHLTGEEAFRAPVSPDTDAERLWTRMAEALEQGLPVVAGTSERASTPENAAIGIYGQHNYAVLAVNGEGSGRRVRLRNPWGRRTRDDSVGQNAEYEIDYERFRTYFVRITVGYQAPEAGRDSGISGPSAPSDESVERGQWESERERMLHLVEQGDVQQASTILGGLIRRAAGGVTPPAPLQPQAIGRLRLNPGTGDRSTSPPTVVAGGADPRWAFREPDDYWRWIEFRWGSIGETEAYTRSVIWHELQHCADIERDRQDFLQQAGPHTEDRFVDYVRAHSGTRARHTEIYAQQATDTAFAEWSDGDRLDWLSGALAELPLLVPRDRPLPIEHRIERFYQEAAPADRSAIMREFVEATVESIRQSRGNDDALRILYGRTRTILDHFPTIWQAEGRTHEVIARNLERSIPAHLRGSAAH